MELETKLDKEVFYDKYELLLQYFDDMKATNKLLSDRLEKLENKPTKNKINSFLFYYNIGSIIVNVLILIKLFL